jgi:outer membrane immunogenic protein
MYRKLLLASAGAIALAGSAVAADLRAPPPPPPPYVPPPPVFTWTGVYIGGQVGGVWGVHAFDPFTSERPSGVIGGAHLGYQVQFNQWIIGIEGSADGTSLSRTATAVFPGVLPGEFTTVSADGRSDIQGSIRGKIGLAWDRFMIYGTGGLAVGHFRTDISAATVIPPVFTFASASFDRTRVGWTAGGGVQYALTPNWWVFAEYRFSDFGRVSDGLLAAAFAPPAFGGRHFQENQVQGGFSYKFDMFGPPPAPLVTKY